MTEVELVKKQPVFCSYLFVLYDKVELIGKLALFYDISQEFCSVGAEPGHSYAAAF